ncbi:hypothetical protein Sjap_007125 [Stephania japonica]|uniref:Uncharacterized protein n=1 Tax=Stephania japonica TaxID=461633 RepID=A0AAP0JMZ7_9MAGN
MSLLDATFTTFYGTGSKEETLPICPHEAPVHEKRLWFRNPGLRKMQPHEKHNDHSVMDQDRVPTELNKAIMQARMDKKLTQAQLAQIRPKSFTILVGGAPNIDVVCKRGLYGSVLADILCTTPVKTVKLASMCHGMHAQTRAILQVIRQARPVRIPQTGDPGSSRWPA